MQAIGGASLYFYDAISPIVSADSLDYSKLYFANRYDKGETADFLNLPLTQEQYETFVDEILKGDVVLPHDFEEEKYFEGCMPIEAIAARGRKTLSFGPMKPVGLDDPKTGRRPHAVIQLRTENKHKTAFNLVGFQTKLKYGEQARIFRQLPGLENAEFLRLGSMHRNTYLDSPARAGAELEAESLAERFHRRTAHRDGRLPRIGGDGTSRRLERGELIQRRSSRSASAGDDAGRCLRHR